MEFLLKVVHAFNPSQEAFLFLWAILTVGVFSLSIIIERFAYLTSRQGVASEKFTTSILEHLQRNDVPAAIKLCDAAKKMALAQVVRAGLNQANAGSEKIRNAIDESMLKTVPLLEKRTGYLAVIGNVSTLIGLLGTVYGLIMSFAAVGRPGIDATQKSELLAAGIATAMNATFCGLTVAITAIMLFALMKSKTQKIVDELDEYSLRVVNVLMERSYQTYKYFISSTQLKEGVGVHVTHNNIKIFTDNNLIKELTL